VPSLLLNPFAAKGKRDGYATWDHPPQRDIDRGRCCFPHEDDERRAQRTEREAIRARWLAAQRALNNRPLTERESEHAHMALTYLLSPQGLIIAGVILILWSGGAKFFWGW
jgi:hypothetical protein